MRANKRHLLMNYKKADNRSSWLTGYRLCVCASGSVITDVTNHLFYFDTLQINYLSVCIVCQNYLV